MSRGRNLILVIAWSMVFIWMSVIHTMWEYTAVETAWVVPNAFDRGCGVLMRAVGPGTAVTLAFMFLGVLVSHAFARYGMSGKENGHHTVLVCMLFAVSEEIYQLLIPGHVFSVVEVIANGAAILAGLTLYGLIHFVLKQVGSWMGRDGHQLNG